MSPSVGVVSRTLPPLSRDPTRDDVDHFLRRTAFFPTIELRERTEREGLAASVDRLLGGAEPAAPEEAAAIGASVQASEDVEVLAAAWLHRILGSPEPLRERLTLFFHNRFVSALSKVQRGRFLVEQIELLRRLGPGPFLPLVQAITRDPAMIRYLDLERSTKASPNENFARELLELFTMGPGHYTEADIREAARALTGYRIRHDRFEFSPAAHDDGSKTFLGRLGAWSGDDIVRMAVEHPGTARHLGRALLRHFVTDAPGEPEIEAVGRLIVAQSGNLRAVLRELFTSDWFFAPAHRFALTRSPVDLVVAASLALGRTLPPLEGARHLVAMGQSLLDAPSVKGYEGGAAWRSPASLLARRSYLASLAERGREPAGAASPEVSRDLEGVTAAAQAVLGRVPPPDELALLLRLARKSKSEATSSVTGTVLIHPWFQVA